MKIRTSDIYRVQSAKYDFCTQFVSGNVLDITCGNYLDFVKSNLLLKNGAKEVFSLDLLNDDQFIISRRLEKGKIICHMKNKKELDSIHFDTIIAFDVLSTVENFDNILKFISNNLKSNGTSIISIVSDDDDAPTQATAEQDLLEIEQLRKQYYIDKARKQEQLDKDEANEKKKLKNNPSLKRLTESVKSVEIVKGLELTIDEIDYTERPQFDECCDDCTLPVNYDIPINILNKWEIDTCLCEETDYSSDED